MKKFLIIIFMSLVTSASYFGLTSKKTEQQKDFQNVAVQETTQENVIQNEIPEENQEDTVSEVENIVEPQEDVSTNKILQNNQKRTEKPKDTNIDKKNEVQETKPKNNELDEISKVTTVPKTTEQNNCNTQTTITTTNTESKSTKKVDLSKYLYYEKASNGSYKAFLVDNTEINNLKALIDNAIKSFGYKNVKIIQDSSLVKDGTMYFTANTINVENAVYDSEGFNIYFYAVKEYWVSPDGTEKYFQTRSYIKVK